MKAERRHELQQNTLDEELTRIGRWLKAHGMKLLAAIVLVAVLAGGVGYWRLHQRQQIQRVHNLYNEARLAVLDPTVTREQVLQQYQALLAQDESEWLAAQAANLLGREYAIRALQAEDPNERRQQIDQARQYYLLVTERYRPLTVQAANAHYALGKLAETTGQFDQARQHYQAVLAMDGLRGQPLLTLAEQALENLDDYTETPVVFSTRAPQAATQPATAPAAGPSATELLTPGPAELPPADDRPLPPPAVLTDPPGEPNAPAPRTPDVP